MSDFKNDLGNFSLGHAGRRVKFKKSGLTRVYNTLILVIALLESINVCPGSICVWCDHRFNGPMK